MRYYKQNWVAVEPPNVGGGSNGTGAPKNNRMPLWAILLIVLVLALLGGGVYAWMQQHNNAWRSAVVYIRVQHGTQAVSGSGAIISPTGYILTNKHVIFDENGKKPDKILVLFNSGNPNREEFTAQLTRANPSYQWFDKTKGAPDPANMVRDWCVIKIDKPGDNLPYIAVGDSRVIQEGAAVQSAGFPLGNEGATSANGPNLVSGPSNITRCSKNSNGAVIRFSHNGPLDKGGSGGPLLSTDGKLIGMETAMMGSGSGKSEDLAIPAHELLDPLKQYAPENPFK